MNESIIKFNLLWSQYELINKYYIRWLISHSELGDEDFDDNFSYNIMIKLYKYYRIRETFVNRSNELFINKKIRKDSFPSEVFENIAKFALKRLNIISYWKIKTSDLTINTLEIVVKGFIFNRPCIFKHNEKWDNIIFVDFRAIINNHVKVFLINLNNTSKIWKNIKIKENETYNYQCINKKKPTISFDNLKCQIPNKYIYKIYEGSIYNLS